MGIESLWVFPFMTFAITVFAFLICYGIAIWMGHSAAFWSYISDNGAFQPESGIFGFLLDIAAFFMMVTVYLRHRQIVEFYWHRHRKGGRWRKISLILLWIGYISCLGVLLVANFQVSTGKKVVTFIHKLGALLTFGVGLVYAWAQMVFSYRMTPRLTQLWICHFRLALCSASAVFLITGIVMGIISGDPQPLPGEEKGYNIDGYKRKLWKSDMPGYTLHVLATACEWLLATCFEMYFLSFAFELRNAYCHAPKLRLKGELPWEQSRNKLYPNPPSVASISPGLNGHHKLFDPTALRRNSNELSQDEDSFLKMKF